MSENTTTPVKDTVDTAPVKDTATEEPKVYAGKYKSVDDLEAGYNNLQKMHSQVANEGKQTFAELNGVKQQLADINKNMQSMQQPQQSAQPDFKQQQDQVYADFDAGTIDEKIMATRLANIAAGQTAQQYKQALNEQSEALKNQFNDQLLQRDQEKVYSEFTTQNPDYESMLSSGQLQEIVASDPLVRDTVDAFYKVQLANAASAAEQAKQQAFAAGQAEALKQVSGSEPSKSVTAGAGQQSPAPAGAEAPYVKPTKSQLMESGLSAFRGAA